MLADRAMWASVALVDYLRNGVPLEDAPKIHLARSLAALMNAYRFELDEYWERQMQLTDGQPFLMALNQEGSLGWNTWDGTPGALDKYCGEISAALRDRSWPALRALPAPVWDILGTVTGMTADEWENLPEFCRGLLSERMICPECEHSAPMERFGEPNPIDEPSHAYADRIGLVFRCANCGAEVAYSITLHQSKEYHPSIFGSRRFIKWIIVGIFGGLVILALILHLGWHAKY